ncbi:IclR family transcriptional regulator [Actinomadura darangshiensis]|uniref:IclR family transcriptional regulator n=1 Tax=Actinomadura darangshiensis TaxID=705336 RepID=A0A4R5B521_9ACTN|nr:IclR family transcriptional regulator [Actinomadura darangshiensis]TDD81348.1 IclR family transcriptional regulator [Actinomadura darangshiensis]
MPDHAGSPDADPLSEPEYSAPPQYPIESVDNALRLLWLIGERGALRLTDAGDHLGVASSTAHRLLAMLQYRGFVRQNRQSRMYEPGPSIDKIAFSLLARLDVRERARPVLERLNAELRETVHLGRLEGQLVHFIDSIESPRAVRVGSRLGRSMLAHCTSTGKAMLAQLPDAGLVELYPEPKLEQMTSESIDTRDALLDELREVRRKGYATSKEESEDGVASVAVALPRSSRTPLALNISVPVNRMNAATRRAIAAALTEAVKEIDELII